MEVKMVMATMITHISAVKGDKMMKSLSTILLFSFKKGVSTIVIYGDTKETLSRRLALMVYPFAHMSTLPATMSSIQAAYEFPPAFCMLL